MCGLPSRSRACFDVEIMDPHGQCRWRLKAAFEGPRPAAIPATHRGRTVEGTGADETACRFRVGPPDSLQFVPPATDTGTREVEIEVGLPA
jgi:hypothetical protein